MDFEFGWMEKTIMGGEMETLDAEYKCDSINLVLCFCDRVEPLSDAQCIDAVVLVVEQFVRASYFSVESAFFCRSNYFDFQPIGVVECEFSVEFCSSGKHYVGWE